MDIFQTGICDEKYEELRQILEVQNRHTYTLEETKEIGEGLLDFFELLLNLSSEEEPSKLDP